MSTQTKFSLLVLITFSLFLVSECYWIPAVVELQRCQMRCLDGHHLSSTQEHLCLIQCHQAYRQENGENGENGGNPQIDQEACARENEAPERKYKDCTQICSIRKKGEEERKQCLEKCKEEYRKERGEGNSNGKKKEEEEEEKRKKKKEKNPYFFEEQVFEPRFKTQEGQFKVLERFSQKSELLLGIDNYRLAILEANPSTFVVPHHCDAEAVYVVINGQGTINFVQQQQRESYNLQRGDGIKVPAGSTVYLINQDKNEKLRILMLVHPINTPGSFEEFFGAGGQDPESFYRVFSNEVLEAALNTPRDRLQRLFGQQTKAIIIKASEEQIRALSQQAGSSSQEGESRGGPFNLLNQQPLFSNQFGQFFEVSPNENEQLRDLDAYVAIMNINQGAMIAPYYNTKSTILVLVAGGSGRFEMACPHLASQGQGSNSNKKKEKEQGKQGVHYKNVSAQLSVGDVFVIPAGHPISIISSESENLQLVGFGIKAQNNQKNFLAGQDNIWNQVESEAKALSFKLPAGEVDEIFRSQEQSYFLPGPKQCQQREEGKSQPMASILEFVGFV